MFERAIFSARLKELIQRLNMTYAQLARALGVSTAQASDMACISSARPLRCLPTTF